MLKLKLTQALRTHPLPFLDHTMHARVMPCCVIIALNNIVHTPYSEFMHCIHSHSVILVIVVVVVVVVVVGIVLVGGMPQFSPYLINRECRDVSGTNSLLNRTFDPLAASHIRLVYTSVIQLSEAQNEIKISSDRGNAAMERTISVFIIDLKTTTAIATNGSHVASIDLLHDLNYGSTQIATSESIMAPSSYDRHSDEAGAWLQVETWP